MRKVENLTVEFKKELSNIELRGIEGIINDIGNNGDTYDLALLQELTHEQYGLAYTSSSAYAMYNVTERIFFDRLGEEEVSHFAITTNDMLIMVVSDSNEYYTYYEIEPTDFN
jgi:hypothetical protein